MLRNSHRPSLSIIRCVSRSAPRVGSDSPVVTFDQQLGRFDVVAGSGDAAFGVMACNVSAKTAFGWAIQNANRHEYFAENTN